MEALTELFGYNRGNFMFDRKLRQEREYMEQKMRIKQFLLYREDIRDLTNLTVSKMDSYLLVSLLELGCCLDLLVEGVIKGPIKKGTEEHLAPPTWLLWLYVISLASAMLYLFLCAWLAIHASVSAHSFSVRLLTQFVRLPVPNRAQLDAATARGEDWEAGPLAQLMRVPVISERMPVLGGQDVGRQASDEGPQTSADGLIQIASNNPVLALEHVQVYRQLQANWQAHDAYARACLCIGTYTLLHALAYYLVGLLVVELTSPWPGFGCSLALPFMAWLLIRLDLLFGKNSLVLGTLVLVMGPLLAMVGSMLLKSAASGHSPFSGIDLVVHLVLVPVTFILHILLIVAIGYVARAEHVQDGSLALPTQFRTVLYLDVFGWLQPGGQSHTAGLGAFSAPIGGAHPPGALRELRKKCSSFVKMLELEFKAWERFQRNTDNSTLMPLQIHKLRRRFETEDAIRRFREGLRPEAEEAPSNPVWLKVSYKNSEYYCRSGDTDLTNQEPEDGALVSYPDAIANRLDELCLALPALDNSTQAQNASALRRGNTQVVEFGGTEAARDVRQVAGQPFHPRQDGRRETSRPPGQMPWTTFFYSSSVLVLVWLVGCCYYTISPVMGWTDSGEMPVDPGAPELSDGQQLFSSSLWQHRPTPLKPISIASHPALGPVLLVAERFAVHSADFGAVTATGGAAVPPLAAAAQPVAEVEACLAAEPTFHSAGIAGLNIDCRETGSQHVRDCSVLLLGADGHHALRCPLSWQSLRNASGSSARRGGSAAAAARPELLRVRVPEFAGESWRMLSVASAASAAQGAWVSHSHHGGVAHVPLRSGETTRTGHGVQRPRQCSHSSQLIQRGRGSRQAPPSAPPLRTEAAGAVLWRPGAHAWTGDIATGAESGLQATDATTTMLDISPKGLLRIWRLTSAPTKPQALPRPTTWRLPAHQHWVAACTQDGHVFAATALGELWRFDLPDVTLARSMLA